MKRITFIAAISIVTLVSGCGAPWLVAPGSNPVIEDKVGIKDKEVLGTLATTANRRTVLVKLTSSKEKNDAGKFCAEPPPDVAENIVSQLKLLLEAEAKITPPAGKAGGEGKAKGDFEKLLNTTIQALGKRSQGLQLFRDGMYNYCQAYLNDAMNESEFQKQSSDLLTAATKLITKELELTDGNISTLPIAEVPSVGTNKK